MYSYDFSLSESKIEANKYQWRVDQQDDYE